MGYPNLPNNRLIVEGVDLSERFKMVLLDGYTLTPPTPKTYVVDIPGGNGKIDLTESLLGDTAYNNRTMTFTFAVIDIENFEKVKTEISNFLHGRAFDFRMTMDPDYIYHGRFTINSCTHNAYNVGIIGQIVIGIDAEPFKHRATQVRRACAIGGNVFFFESGRERVCPIVETDGWLRIIFDGKQIDLAQGTWTVNDLLFKQGTNKVYMNSFPVHNLTWGNLRTNSVNWKQFGERALYKWYKSSGDSSVLSNGWESIAGKSWSEFTNSKWASVTSDLDVAAANVKDIFFKYEWGDL